MKGALSSGKLCFGLFKLDVRAGEVHKGDRRIRLQEQPFQVLKMLIESEGEIVTREEIRKRLWPNDTVVEFDHSINAAIKKLRLASAGGFGRRAEVRGDGGPPWLPFNSAGGVGESEPRRRPAR